MTDLMRWQWLSVVLATIAILLILVLAYAWRDGGREPLRPIAESVPLPKAGR